MSDIEEKKSQIIKAQGKLQTIHTDFGLMKVNRFLVAVVFFLMTMVLILGFLLFPDQAINFKYKGNLSTSDGADMSPVLSAEVNTLKGQVIGLVSGSIESKLRTLEESIRLGTVTNSLGTIADLKNDVKVLRSYSKPVENTENAAGIANEQILREVSQLKKLIYVSLASCGLMLAAVAGIWLKNSNRLPYKKVITHFLGKH